MAWIACLAECAHYPWRILRRVMHPTRDASAAFSAVPSVGIVGKKRLFSLGRIPVRPDNGVFIEKPCNTVRRYKSYGIFSTLFSCTADHTIPILDRAAAAAVPTGILIWFLGSMAYVGPATDSSAFLSPGMDGGSLLEAIIRFLIIRPVSLVWTAPY